jgi:hypothetical protein
MKTAVWTLQAVCILGLVGLLSCTSTTPSSIASPRMGTSQDQATIQALQKRLEGRERTIVIQNYQIQIMSGQLEALKRIDQDTRRPVGNFMRLTP